MPVPPAAIAKVVRVNVQSTRLQVKAGSNLLHGEVYVPKGTRQSNEHSN